MFDGINTKEEFYMQNKTLIDSLLANKDADPPVEHAEKEKSELHGQHEDDDKPAANDAEPATKDIEPATNDAEPTTKDVEPAPQQAIPATKQLADESKSLPVTKGRYTYKPDPYPPTYKIPKKSKEMRGRGTNRYDRTTQKQETQLAREARSHASRKDKTDD